MNETPRDTPAAPTPESTAAPKSAPAAPAAAPASAPAPNAGASAHALGLGVILAGAVLLLLAARRPPLPNDAGDPLREPAIPRVLEPIGDVDAPPTRFRWRKSGDAVELSQVVVYRSDGARIWETAPTDSSWVEIPAEAYAGIRAGEKCYWRVREVADGHALASSGVTRFVFRRDLRGNEAPAHLLGLPLPPGTPPPLEEDMGPLPPP